MSYSSEDAAIINQTNHIVSYRLELLNEYLQVISELTGDTAEVNFNIDSTSDIRRTADLTMVVKDRSWLTDNFEIGWLDKLVRFSIGLKYDGPGATALIDEAQVDYSKIEETAAGWRWYPLGTMLLTSDAFRFDTATQELHLSLVDLMAYGTPERGSQIGTGVKLTYESNISHLLEETIARWLPYKQTDIDQNFPDVLPYDMTFGAGSYPYDLLSGVLGLFPWYEQYYDAEGVYHAQKTPMNVDEPCLLTPEDLNDLIIAENKTFEFNKIKNSTEIWGKAISAHYTATSCTLDGDTYTLGFVLNEMETLENNKKYCFTPLADSPASPKIHIELTDPEAQDTAVLLNSDGNELAAGAMRAGYAYVARCLEIPEEVDGTTTIVRKFYLMGQKQIHVIVREMNVQPDAATMEDDRRRNDCMDIRYVINPDSPYACDRYNTQTPPVRYSITKGEIRQVLTDREYGNIYSTQLAYERGAYENWLKCRVNTDVELTTVLIPFIDVNKKIEYTSPITGETHQYLVKSVNMDVAGFTMTMQLARFYNYYPTGDSPAENDGQT